MFSALPADEATNPDHRHEQVLFTQAGIVGLSGLLGLEPDEFRARLHKAARALAVEPPDDVRITGWYEQAQTLEEE